VKQESRLSCRRLFPFKAQQPDRLCAVIHNLEKRQSGGKPKVNLKEPEP